MAKELVPAKNITILIQAIRNEIEQGRKNVINIIETEKTKTCRNIGKHIYRHLLDFGNRADYGDYVIKTLAESLHIGRVTLYRTIQFYKIYPENLHALRQLGCKRRGTDEKRLIHTGKNRLWEIPCVPCVPWFFIFLSNRFIRSPSARP